NDTPHTEIYTTRHTLSLHDALPISSPPAPRRRSPIPVHSAPWLRTAILAGRSEEHTSELQSRLVISYAVSCLKKKTRLNSIHAFLFRMPSYDKKKKNNTH